jgi:hypothetical protein
VTAVPSKSALTLKRLQDYKSRWERELGEYLGEVPHFDEVERNIRRSLRQAKLL